MKFSPLSLRGKPKNRMRKQYSGVGGYRPGAGRPRSLLKLYVGDAYHASVNERPARLWRVTEVGKDYFLVETDQGDSIRLELTEGD